MRDNRKTRFNTKSLPIDNALLCDATKFAKLTTDSLARTNIIVGNDFTFCAFFSRRYNVTSVLFTNFDDATGKGMKIYFGADGVLYININGTEQAMTGAITYPALNINFVTISFRVLSATELEAQAVVNSRPEITAVFPAITDNSVEWRLGVNSHLLQGVSLFNRALSVTEKNQLHKSGGSVPEQLKEACIAHWIYPSWGGGQMMDLAPFYDYKKGQPPVDFWTYVGKQVTGDFTITFNAKITGVKDERYRIGLTSDFAFASEDPQPADGWSYNTTPGRFDMFLTSMYNGYDYWRTNYLYQTTFRETDVVVDNLPVEIKRVGTTLTTTIYQSDGVSVLKTNSYEFGNQDITVFFTQRGNATKLQEVYINGVLNDFNLFSTGVELKDGYVYRSLALHSAQNILLSGYSVDEMKFSEASFVDVASVSLYSKRPNWFRNKGVNNPTKTGLRLDTQVINEPHPENSMFVVFNTQQTDWDGSQMWLQQVGAQGENTVNRLWLGGDQKLNHIGLTNFFSHTKPGINYYYREFFFNGTHNQCDHYMNGKLVHTQTGLADNEVFRSNTPGAVLSFFNDPYYAIGTTTRNWLGKLCMAGVWKRRLSKYELLALAANLDSIDNPSFKVGCLRLCHLAEATWNATDGNYDVPDLSGSGATWKLHGVAQNALDIVPLEEERQKSIIGSTITFNCLPQLQALAGKDYTIFYWGADIDGQPAAGSGSYELFKIMLSDSSFRLYALSDGLWRFAPGYGLYDKQPEAVRQTIDFLVTVRNNEKDRFGYAENLYDWKGLANTTKASISTATICKSPKGFFERFVVIEGNLSKEKCLRIYKTRKLSGNVIVDYNANSLYDNAGIWSIPDSTGNAVDATLSAEPRVYDSKTVRLFVEENYQANPVYIDPTPINNKITTDGEYTLVWFFQWEPKISSGREMFNYFSAQNSEPKYARNILRYDASDGLLKFVTLYTNGAEYRITLGTADEVKNTPHLFASSYSASQINIYWDDMANPIGTIADPSQMERILSSYDITAHAFSAGPNYKTYGNRLGFCAIIDQALTSTELQEIQADHRKVLGYPLVSLMVGGMNYMDGSNYKRLLNLI